MPRPDHLKLTLDDVLKELESWPNASAKPNALETLTEEQRKILCVLMRSGKRMDFICEKWKGWGLAGSSPNTMRRMYRALEKQGY